MNKTAHLVLPFTGVDTRSYEPRNFCNAFLAPDLKSVIIELYGPIEYHTLRKENFLCAWEYNGFTYFEYSIPVDYYRDVEKFLEGRYSEYSDNARAAIIKAIRVIVVEQQPTFEDINMYKLKVMTARHKVAFKFLGKPYDTFIIPDEFAAIGPRDSKRFINLKKERELLLGLEDESLPNNAELISKPELKKEIINKNIYESKNSKQVK